MSDLLSQRGLWCIRCPSCKWLNYYREHARPYKEVPCVACGTMIPDNAGSWFYEEHIACIIATLADDEGRAIQEIAQRHGFLVHRGTGNGARTRVYKVDCPMTVSFGDGQKRAFMNLVEAFSGSWQAAMRYLRDKIKEDLPKHLKGK